MTETDLPIESFEPELQALLVKGSKELITWDAVAKGPPGSVEFKLEMNRFVALRQRLHRLRTLIAKRDPAVGAMLYKAKVVIYSDRSPLFGKMQIMPRDAQFADMMESAGVSTPALPANLLEDK